MTSMPNEKGFYVGWEQAHRDSRALAWRLDDKSEKLQWKAILAVSRGGLMPAMIIARELNIRAVDTISIKSYNHQDHGIPEILKFPDKELMGDGSNILVVDDLVDTGTTLKLIRSMLPKAKYCTVYAKPKGCEYVDIFITEVSQDTWIYLPWDMAMQYSNPYRNE